MDYIAELEWRGLLQVCVEEVRDFLQKGSQKAYIGFDPTADSLHAGNLLTIMLLVHFQKAGHQPVVLVGGATGRIGDPSGKSNERTLLDEATLQKNIAGIQKQLLRFLDFENINNKAILLDNYSWTQGVSFLDFIRDIGKYLTVNYMMAKDSVKNRIQSEQGISFTEFSYQLLQAFDFLHLFEKENCKIQMGGSDQWGNITSGIELIHKKIGQKAYGIVAPLLTKSDGTKFGKSESGAIWLDPTKTSPYQFYQFWLNASDEDAQKWIKIFTLFDKITIENLIAEHQLAPEKRLLQKTLASDITQRVHGKEALEKALAATEILFGQSTLEQLQSLEAATFAEVFGGVAQFGIEKEKIQIGLDLIDTVVAAGFVESKSQMRKILETGAFHINKQKITANRLLNLQDVLAEKYILLQNGKKKYFLLYLK